MGQSIKYRILFSIDVLHHYFLDKGEKHYESLNNDDKVKQLATYNVQDFLNIQPTPSCAKAIKDHQLIFRKTNKGILVGCKIDASTNKPFIDIPEGLKFTFQVKVQSPEFFNFSALPLNFGSPKGFYFNNLEKNAADQLNLSKNAETFQLGNAYQAGELLSDSNGTALVTVNNTTENAIISDITKDEPAAIFEVGETYKKGDVVLITNGGIDQLFEAKIDDPADTPEDVAENDWKKRIDLPLNYINNSDLIRILKPIHNYALVSDAVQATAIVSILTTDGFVDQQTDLISGTTSFQFDWRRLPSAYYRLLVTDDNLPNDHDDKIMTEETFYLNNGDFQSSPFGIIEIYTAQDDNNPYALLKEDGTFQDEENKFILRFKNRSTIWRYIFKESQAVQAEDDVIVENNNDKTLITSSVKPLTRYGVITINKGSERLSNPTAKMIKPESNNIYSEIYL